MPSELFYNLILCENSWFDVLVDYCESNVRSDDDIMPQSEGDALVILFIL